MHVVIMTGTQYSTHLSYFFIFSYDAKPPRDQLHKIRTLVRVFVRTLVNTDS